MRIDLAPLGSFDIGAGLAAIIAIVAWRARSLTVSGAVAAFLVGTATFGALRVPGAAVLLTFFVSSTLLSRIGKTRKRERLADIGKIGPRDAAQVLANGGIAALCALLALVLLNWQNTTGAWLAESAFCGAFAAANADTWATEIGTLMRGKPRSIISGRHIEPGLSGGVTFAGSLAQIAGAMAIAAVAAWTFVVHNALVFASLVTIAGIAGALADSIFGATLQTLRWCPQCKRPTETEPHRCGANTRVLRGSIFLGNDGVNFICTAVGALVAAALRLRFDNFTT